MHAFMHTYIHTYINIYTYIYIHVIISDFNKPDATTLFLRVDFSPNARMFYQEDAEKKHMVPNGYDVDPAPKKRMYQVIGCIPVIIHFQLLHADQKRWTKHL